MAKFDAGMESMLDTYIFETTTLLEQLDEILMRTEKEDSIGSEDIAEIFRIMHTIKGSSAMMGLSNMSTLAHSVEDLFFIVRENPDAKYDKAILYELVFGASDGLKNEIDVITDDSLELTDFTQMIAKIRAYAEVMKSLNGQGSVNEDVKEERIFEDGESEDIMTLHIDFDEACMMPAIRSMLIIKKLGDVCEITRTIPGDLEAQSSSDILKKKGLTLKLLCDNADAVMQVASDSLNVEKAQWLKKSVAVKQDNQPVATTTQSDNPAPPKTEAVPKKASVGEKSSIISVKLSKLDSLLDLVGEIVITESMVSSSPDLKGLETNLERFLKSTRQLKKLTDELQDVVMSIRMVPVSNAFSKMSRVVRDMNQKLGKNVELVFEGEDTEVDKSVVDILNDPLMHLVRNAVDHGIEDPEVRKKAGKTEPPRVTLSANSASGEVIITVADNGVGMDHKKLLAKAKKNGILRKPEEDYTRQEALNLIMRAGFSTNEKVTEFSGRGVGMDVVRSNIEQVGGKIVVESVLGEGSKFIIKIPLSLSIIDVMGVKVGESEFSIPIMSIKEMFKFDPKSFVRDTDGTELIMIRKKCYPIIRLSEYFGIDGAETDFEKGIMLLCETEGRRSCIFADALLNDQQIVVKPFSSLFSRFDINEIGLTGCSILGDGSITLILDIKAINMKCFES